MGGFQGWQGDFQAFFIGLQLDNSKRYFDAHRNEYQELVRGPLELLVQELEPEFGPSKLFRPNRDTRFSANKEPYKTNVAASGAGGYVSLDAKGLTAAGGRYHLEPPELARFRTAVAAERSGSQLAGIVAGLRAKGYDVHGEELKRVPPPHPQEHPRGALLRHKRLIYWRGFGLQPWLATPEVTARVAEVWRDGRPLQEWFREHVG